MLDQKEYSCAEWGPRLPIAHAFHLLSTQEWEFGGWRGDPPIFKIIGKPLLGEKYVEEKKKKNNAKFSGHYVRPRMHAQRLCARTPLGPILNNIHTS